MRVGTGLALAASILVADHASAQDAPARYPSAQDALARYRGTSRVLVLSAPDASDRRLADQRAALDADRDGVGERDLVVVEAVGAGAAAAAIRRRLGLPADAFRAVLVGKDGGAKITAREPIPPQRLFATIDAMPMRREEMRRGR